MSSLPIGVLDSGIGGASILKEVMKVLPNERFVYLVDNKNIPYGSKSERKIFKIVKDNVDFLIKTHNIKALILACNTASSVCATKLRETLDIPIIGVEPAIKPAIECGYKKIIILATNRTLQTNKTIKSNIKSVKIKNKDCKNEDKIIIRKKAIKSLALEVDKNCNNLEKIEPILNRKLKKFKNFDALIIGCTHFNFIKKQLQKTLPDTNLINCETAVAKRTKYILERYSLKNTSTKVVGNVLENKSIVILTKPNFIMKKFIENYLEIIKK